MTEVWKTPLPKNSDRVLCIICALDELLIKKFKCVHIIRDFEIALNVALLILGNLLTRL